MVFDLVMQEWAAVAALGVAGLAVLILSFKQHAPKGSLSENRQGNAAPPDATVTQEHQLTAGPAVPLPVATHQPLPDTASPAAESPKDPWHKRLKAGLSKTQEELVRKVTQLFGQQDAAEDLLYEQMFEILVRADVGVSTSQWLVDEVRQALTKVPQKNPDVVRSILKKVILELLQSKGTAPGSVDVTSSAFFHAPLRITLMVGVNGVGKTTTTGKLAHRACHAGFVTVVAAADTFRAAAVEQLKVWGQRAGAAVITRPEGSDPAAVAFDAVAQARESNARWCVIDTAGRLHNRNDLMQELAKIKRVATKDDPNAPLDVWLVLDATTGQNALQQVKIFKEVVNITGLVLTKLDGTAKGGVVLGIVREWGLPICYVGVGEGVADLQPFSAEEFVDALF